MGIMGVIKGCIEAADVVTCPRELQQDEGGSSRRHPDAGGVMASSPRRRTQHPDPGRCSREAGDFDGSWAGGALL